MPYMYHYADRPDLSAIRSREIIARDFNVSVNGLPGNDGMSLVISVVRCGCLICFYLRFWSYGKLCCLPSSGIIPSSFDKTIPSLNPVLPRSPVLQPGL